MPWEAPNEVINSVLFFFSWQNFPYFQIMYKRSLHTLVSTSLVSQEHKQVTFNSVLSFDSRCNLLIDVDRELSSAHY